MTVPVCCEEIQIYDSFPKLSARNSQDKRNYMMKYEPWRFDGTRLTIWHDATKQWPFKKMHVYWPWTTRDISIALSWHVQLSTNLTDKSVKINKVKYLSQYMYTTIKYWLNRISTSWCWLSYHLLFGGQTWTFWCPFLIHILLK